MVCVVKSFTSQLNISNVFIFSSIGMGRKLRFSRRKNDERKKIAKRRENALMVSIPLSLLPAPQYIVSFPISVYTSRKVSDGADLHSQLSKIPSLSPSWTIQSPSTETPLVLIKLKCTLPLCSPQIMFSIKVYM